MADNAKPMRPVSGEAMSEPDAAVLDEINSALGSGVDLVVRANKTVQVTDAGSGRTWVVVGTAASVARHAADRTSSGQEAGAGGDSRSAGVSPGAALLAIHIGEAVATAGPETSRLVLRPGGVTAE